MPLLPELTARRTEILALAEECGLTNVRVFGSVARMEDDENSDVDIVVNRIKGKRLGLKTYGFPAGLEKMFNRPIDFVYESRLHPVIKEQILKEARPI